MASSTRTRSSTPYLCGNVILSQAVHSNANFKPQPGDRRLEALVKCYVALEKPNRTLHLGQCLLPASPAERLERLKSWRSANLGTWQKIATYLLCKKLYIAVGTLGPANGPQATLHETQFEKLVKNDTLTRGFFAPSSLVDSPDLFTSVLPSFKVNATQVATVRPERHALVVALEVDRHRIALFILLMAFVGLIGGVLVAVLKHDWGLGAGIGGAMFGFVAVLEGALVLMYG